jgi:hypothetical protein
MRWTVFFAGLLLVAIALSVVNYTKGTWKRADGDLPVYILAAERMADGEEIYRRDDHRPFTYPPFLAFVSIPGTWLPKVAQRPFWYCSMIGLFAVILYIVNRRVAPLRGKLRAWPFWLLLLLLCWRHVNGVRSNQSNDLWIVMLVALCGAAAGVRREKGSGASAALGAAIKATPLLFLPFCVWQRRWTATVALLVALSAVTLVPDVVCPRKDGGLWVGAWANTFLGKIKPGAPAAKEGRAWHPSSVLNQSLSGTLYRLSTPLEKEDKKGMQYEGSIMKLSPGARKAFILGGQLLVLALIALALLPRWSKGLPDDAFAWRRWGEAGAVACGMVLLSPFSSKSHFSILLLPVSFLLGEYLYARRDRWVAVSLVLVFATGTLTSRMFLGKEGAKAIQAYGPVTWCAFAALAGVVYLLVRPGRGDSPTSPA